MTKDSIIGSIVSVDDDYYHCRTQNGEVGFKVSIDMIAFDVESTMIIECKINNRRRATEVYHVWLDWPTS